MNSLTEGWVGVWPTLAMVGAFVTIPGGVVTLLGAIAGIVGNERVATPLVFTGGPLTLGGCVMVFVGVGGWWVILVVVAMVGFGWVVRPRRQHPGHLKQ